MNPRFDTWYNYNGVPSKDCKGSSDESGVHHPTMPIPAPATALDTINHLWSNLRVVPNPAPLTGPLDLSLVLRHNPQRCPGRQASRREGCRSELVSLIFCH
jgi:hypothetical protein